MTPQQRRERDALVDLFHALHAVTDPTGFFRLDAGDPAWNRVYLAHQTVLAVQARDRRRGKRTPQQLAARWPLCSLCGKRTNPAYNHRHVCLDGIRSYPDQ